MKLQKVLTKDGHVAVLRSVNTQTNQLLIEYPNGVWCLVKDTDITIIDN